MRFSKGDKLIATNLEDKKCHTFVCPADRMCNKLLTRYVVMKLGLPNGKYIFNKQ